MNYQRELAKQYAKIGKKLNDPNLSESYLDGLLEVFSTELASIEKSKGNISNEKKLLENLKRVQDNQKFDTEPLILSEDQKIIGSFEKIQAIFLSDTLLTEKQIDTKYKGLKPYLQILENQNVDLDDYTLDHDFQIFLEQLLLKFRKGKFRIDKIHNQEVEEQAQSEVTERLNSYFNDTRYKKPIKKFSNLVENIKNEENQDNWNIEKNLLNTFWLALRNLYLDQSSINKARSLFNSGASMKEAIKTVVTNKATRSNIESLVRKYQNKSHELQEAQKRLI